VRVVDEEAQEGAQRVVWASRVGVAARGGGGIDRRLLCCCGFRDHLRGAGRGLVSPPAAMLLLVVVVVGPGWRGRGQGGGRVEEMLVARAGRCWCYYRRRNRCRRGGRRRRGRGRDDRDAPRLPLSVAANLDGPAPVRPLPREGREHRAHHSAGRVLLLVRVLLSRALGAARAAGRRQRRRRKHQRRVRDSRVAVLADARGRDGHGQKHRRVGPVWRRRGLGEAGPDAFLCREKVRKKSVSPAQGLAVSQGARGPQRRRKWLFPRK